MALRNEEYEVIRLPDVIGRGYKSFWSSRHRYRVLKGGKASKKSTTTALGYIYHLMKYPEANLLVVRAVLNTHKDSTMAQLKWAVNRLKVAHLWRFSKNPLEATYIPTGQRILFRGFDDAQKLASIKVDVGVLCWVWIEEAFEIKDEEEFNKLDLSAPRGEVPPGYFKQTTLTFNPWSDRHWIKKRFFDTPQPNVWSGTTNYLCNEWLDDTDRMLYEQMKQDNPRRYDVAGLGNWGIAEGLVYENWVVEAFDMAEIKKREDYWKYKHVFGLDYGYSNDPTAFVAAAVNTTDKVLYIYDEHYETRMLNSDIAKMLAEKGVAKEQIRADAAEPKSNDELRRLGIHRILPATKGQDSIRAGIARLQEYRIIVHSTCKYFCGEISTYCWSKRKDTGDGINRPVDRDNHLMDALRYAMEDVIYFRPREKVPRGTVRDKNGGFVYENKRHSNEMGHYFTESGWE